MTSFQRDTLLSGWPSFPRKRESISVSESRNSSDEESGGEPYQVRVSVALCIAFPFPYVSPSVPDGRNTGRWRLVGNASEWCNPPCPPTGEGTDERFRSSDRPEGPGALGRDVPAGVHAGHGRGRRVRGAGRIDVVRGRGRDAEERGFAACRGRRRRQQRHAPPATGGRRGPRHAGGPVLLRHAGRDRRQRRPAAELGGELGRLA